MTSDPNSLDLTAGQLLALEQLGTVAESAFDRLKIGKPYMTRGHMATEIELDLSGAKAKPGGVRLQTWEKVRILIPQYFPFSMPSVEVDHLRWAGLPHVQFGCQICLYASPSVEWDPSDGMYGYLGRLVTWLQRAAAGELTPVGQPLHPPVAYARCDDVVVVGKDTGLRGGSVPWLGAVLLKKVKPWRADVVRWLTEDEIVAGSAAEAGITGRADSPGEARSMYGPAIVLGEEIGFEYPLNTSALIEALAAAGVSRTALLRLFYSVAYRSTRLYGQLGDPGASVSEVDLSSYFLIGTPSIGIAGQKHRDTSFVAWRTPDELNLVLAARVAAHLASDSFRDFGLVLQGLVDEHLESHPIEWATVLEARPELVTRRDAAAPAGWLSGKRVLVLGAGALGAPAAEAVARGGAAEVTTVDRSDVHPGILVRQPYADAEIGLPKARVLAGRLGSLGLACSVRHIVGDAAELLRGMRSGGCDYDLIIDATADRALREELESHRSPARGTWPPTVSLMIGHTARHGIATVSLPHGSGGPADILRRLSLLARAENDAETVNDFFPDPPRTDLFQPERGCSEATFIGGLSDVTGLVGQLLTGALDLLAQGANDPQTPPMLAIVVHAPDRKEVRAGVSRSAGPTWYGWRNDRVMRDASDRYEIRLSGAAFAAMRKEARYTRDSAEPAAETGGLLLGAVDDGQRVVWIDEATEPSPDADRSRFSFTQGTENIEEFLAERRRTTSRVSQFVGMWHTHPHGVAFPSPTDEAGMATLLVPLARAPRRALLLIVGGTDPHWSDWLDNDGPPDLYARIVERRDVSSTE